MRRGGRILPRAPAPPRPEIILYGNTAGDIAPGEEFQDVVGFYAS